MDILAYFFWFFKKKSLSSIDFQFLSFHFLSFSINPRKPSESIFHYKSSIWIIFHHWFSYSYNIFLIFYHLVLILQVFMVAKSLKRNDEDCWRKMNHVEDTTNNNLHCSFTVFLIAFFHYSFRFSLDWYMVLFYFLKSHSDLWFLFVVQVMIQLS